MTLSCRFETTPPVIHQNETCGICLDDLVCELNSKGPPVSHAGTLTHVFHRGCLDKWVRITQECPLCRGKITHIQGGDLEERNKALEGMRLLSSSVFTFFIGGCWVKALADCVRGRRIGPLGNEVNGILYTGVVINFGVFTITEILSRRDIGVPFQRFFARIAEVATKIRIRIIS